MGSHLQSFCMSTMILLIVFSATLAICQPTSTTSFEQNTPNISQIFEDWMKKHDRVYSNSEEKARRFGIFKAKYQYIQNFNKEGGKKLYTLGLNQFSDMTRKEFQSNKCRRTTVATGAGIKIFNSSSLDAQISTCSAINVDWSKDTWSENGAVSPVSPVRDQGFHCGACWAMAAVAAVEAANRITWGYDLPLPPLSTQQILDCAYGDCCQGGSELDAYAYIAKNKGLASEQGYQYTEMNGTCDESRASHVVGGGIVGLVLVRPQTEDALRQAICQQPVTAGIAANSSDFKEYHGGIFNGPCGQDIDHTVLVVGFGREKGVAYWKIQNSWGKSWGEQGYMRLALEAGGNCAITMDASFPLVDLEL